MIRTNRDPGGLDGLPVIKVRYNLVAIPKGGRAEASILPLKIAMSCSGRQGLAQ